MALMKAGMRNMRASWCAGKSTDVSAAAKKFAKMQINDLWKMYAKSQPEDLRNFLMEK